jgi:hypothetical protein
VQPTARAMARPLQARQGARGRGVARAERVRRACVRRGQWRTCSCGAGRTCGASARFRSQDMSTDRARQAYAAALSTLSAVLSPSTRLHLQTRATAILLALLVPHLYRDVWPLLTPALQPLDSREDAVLWAKLALCAVAGGGVPLLLPFEYVLANPAVRRVLRPLCLF